MSLVRPWLITDADIALWPAWKDGMPYHGPGSGRDRPAALLECKTTLTITEAFSESAATGHGWTGNEMAGGSSWQISIDFPDGAMADTFGRLMSRAHPGGYRILTIRFFDEATGHWTLLNFFYVVPVTDAESENAEKMMRAFTVKSSWLQEKTGSAALPSLAPVVCGEVDWVCGSQRVTALEYDPLAERWTSLPRNETGDGSRYVTLQPMDGEEGSDVILAYYLPRFVPAESEGLPGNVLLTGAGQPMVTGAGDYIVTNLPSPQLPNLAIRWQNTLCLRLGREDSTYHHGLVLQGGHSLQAIGIVEPLITLPQARVIDEPVLHFRFLRRIYATFGHGVLAVPRLTVNESPPVSHDPAFRIAVPGLANRATGNSGLVLLPQGAWLDGTLLTLP